MTYQEGNTIEDKGIISTTSDPKQKFTDRINYDIQIVCNKDSKGKDIDAFSDKKGEMEVAFPTNTRFQILVRTVGGREDAGREMLNRHPPNHEGGRPAWTMDIVMKEV